MLLYIADKIQRILQECILIKMYAKSIDTRLNRLENERIRKKDDSNNELEIIQDQLPIKTINQLTHFDQSMKDANIKKAFVSFLDIL